MSKILFINDYKTGGGAEQVVLQTIELLKDTYEIDYFYGSKISKQPHNILDYIYSNTYYKLLLDKLNNTKPDIIHIANYYHLLSPSILQAIKIYRQTNSVKVIMTTHDFHILSPNSGFTSFSWYKSKRMMIKNNPTVFDVFTKKWDHRGIRYSIAKQLQWFYAYKIKKLDNVIDEFISPSEFLASFLKQKYKQKVHLVRNPLPPIPNYKFSQKQFDENVIRLLFAGRVSEEKGLEKFLLKLTEVNKVKYIFTIIGDGDQLNYLKTLAKNLNLDENIVFKGKLTHRETLKEMQMQNVLVLPSSWYENAPLSLVEGAINGLKILTMNYGGMKEIAEICGNYYLLNKNMEDLENRLISLSNHDFIDSTNKIHSIFSTHTYANSLQKIYE